MKHEFKKKYGQNFLQNNNILEYIKNSFDVDKDSIILEIGAGSGNLTKKLLEKNVKVISFEIDKSLSKFLDNIKNDNLSIVYEDFMKINIKDYIKTDNFYVIANIPYYITTPIITKFIEENIIPKTFILMVQDEVAKRLSSKTGTKEYGAISVILNYFFDIDYLKFVPRTEFYPIPNVDSAIIKLNKKENLINLKSFNNFKRIVNDSFKYKRKTLKNNLKNYDSKIIEEVLKKYNLSLNNRAEDIDYKIFIELTNALFK